MIATLTVSVVAAAATVFAPMAGSPPTAAVCSAQLDGGVFRPAYCGKKPPPKSYEKFRKALASYQVGITGVVASIATAVADLGPIDYPCRNSPPVDMTTVELIVAGMKMTGQPPTDRARKALSDMTSVVDSVFAGNDSLPEVKAVLIGLKSNLDDFSKVMDRVEQAGNLYEQSACDAGRDTLADAADQLVTTGQFSNRSIVSLAGMLAGSHPPCKSTTVKDPYSDKAMRKAAGSKATKTTSTGDMSMEYPTSLDVGGKQVFLPVNLNSKAHSGYVKLEFTRGSKDLVAVGGGTPAGESGLQIKVLGHATPGTGKLRLTFQPAGGAEVTKVVTIRLT